MVYSSGKNDQHWPGSKTQVLTISNDKQACRCVASVSHILSMFNSRIMSHSEIQWQ